VSFSTGFGEAKAFWEGDKPMQNCEYYVEIDIHDVIILSKNILDKKNTYSIQLCDDSIIICGKIDSINDDGYTVIRLGDSIIPFITPDKSLQAGTSVKLSAKYISLYPVYY
jgi:hypothetical protein